MVNRNRVADAAIIAVRRDHRNVADLAQRIAEGDEAKTFVAVVVRNENFRPFAHARSAGFTRLESTKETIESTSAPRKADPKPRTVRPSPKCATR